MRLSKLEIHGRIVSLIENLLQDDLDLDSLHDQIDDNTLLYKDLEITSLKMIELFVAIEENLSRKVGFHDLVMRNGKYISDLGFGELVSYVDRKLNSVATESPNPKAGIKTTQIGTTLGNGMDSGTVARFLAVIPPTLPLNKADPIKNKQAILVYSAPRSGSTLFRIILAGHTALFAPPELHLLQYPTLEERKKIYSYPTNEHLLEGTIQAMARLKNCDIDEARTFLREYEDQHMTTQQFYKLLQENMGHRTLVDKTPAYAYHRNVLERAELIFENPIYIHLVRHPQGSFRSFLDAELDRFFPFMWKNAADFSRQEFAELNWYLCNENISNFLARIPDRRQYRLKFEDLVSSPKATIEGLCAFLNLEFNPEMLDPYKEKFQRMTDGLETVSRMGGDLKFHLHQKIELDIADRWKHSAPYPLSDLTCELAEKFDYLNIA